jgi:protein-S-isoprenylcysteine O-methyltransferase Ste14
MREDKPDDPGRAKLKDILSGLPLILLCATALYGFAIEIGRQWTGQVPSTRLQIVSEASGALFVAMQMGLVFLRRVPLGKAPGLAPRLIAILAANFSYCIALLPRAETGISTGVISSALILAGTAGSSLSLLWLGRGFSILPQARQLATGGPYRLVRHPLYLCEQMSVLGLSLLYARPWGLLIAMAGLALQFPRMRYEESILAATFPKYRAYAAATPQFLPFLYPRRAALPGPGR